MKKVLINSFIVSIFLSSCVTKPPESPDNICHIFEEKRNWYRSAIKAEDKWNLPPHVLMSFVYQESSFRSNAKPERQKLLGFIPWSRSSSALGYSQALDSTWDDYKDETGNFLANRREFRDSADFIGWYADRGYKRGFKKKDAKSLYLAYHEGYSGYDKKTYSEKKWLIEVANKVQQRSSKYQTQYSKCEKNLKRKKFLIFN